jgi:imidazolonepropionase-like amidohydrolase
MIGEKMRNFNLKKFSILFTLTSIMIGFFFFSSMAETEKKVPLIIKAGKIFRVTHPPLEKGIIVIEGDKISAVAENLVIPEQANIVDYSQGMVFPGFIDACTNIGLEDIERDERDSQETSMSIMPHLRVIDALNPENRFIALARRGGVTSALIAPKGGALLSGQSALINLAGKTVEEMLIKFPVGVHATLGEIPKAIYGQRGQMPSTRMGEIAFLRQALVDANYYYQKGKRDHEKRDFKQEALIPVIKGELPLIVQVNRLSDILSALKIAEEFDLRIILNQGTEAYRIVEILSAKRIPVLLAPVEAYYQSIETRGASYDSPFILNKGRVKIAFQTGDIRYGTSLLHQARAAIENGLSNEEALKALTIYPAEIFGVDNQLGSIEAGKLANLVIFEDDPLAGVAKIKAVIIKGKIVEKF